MVLVEQVVPLAQKVTMVTQVIPEQMAALVAAVAVVVGYLLVLLKQVFVAEKRVLLVAQVHIQHHQLTEQVALVVMVASVPVA